MINKIEKEQDDYMSDEGYPKAKNQPQLNSAHPDNCPRCKPSSLKALLESLVEDLEGEKKKLPDEINLEDNPELASKSLQGLGFNSALNLAIEIIRKSLHN